MKRKILTIMMITPFLMMPMMAHASKSSSSYGSYSSYNSYFIPTDPGIYRGKTASQEQQLINADRKRHNGQEKNRRHHSVSNY